MATPDPQVAILEAIESLRRRKARPDLERICHMVERRYGKTDFDVIGELDRMVDAEIVVKVEYKGNISYRNAANWCKSRGSQLNSNDASRSILSAIEKLTVKNAPPSARANNNSNKSGQAPNGGHLALTGQEGAEGETEAEGVVDGQGQGATLGEVEKFFADADPDTKFSRAYLEEALKREVEAKRLHLSPTGKYLLAKFAEESAEQPSAEKTKRSRLPLKQKRKRIKKTHGPEWEQESPVVKTSVWELRCDYCTLAASCNKFGDREELLVCKDCTLKVHPSCMKYSKELAERSRLSPWQCIDCKTCHVCSDAGDADTLLFCDSCDKGYHMACHNPSIEEKPSGKWVCEPCASEHMELGSVCTDEDSVVSSESSGSMLLEEKKEDIESSERPGQVTPDVATPSPSMTANLPVQSSQSQQAGCSAAASAAACKTKKESKDAHPATWSFDHVVDYLARRGFADEALTFKEQEIDGSALLLLRRSDVLTGLSFKLGRALKIYKLVSDLQLVCAKGNGLKGATKSPSAPVIKSSPSTSPSNSKQSASTRANKASKPPALNAAKVSPPTKTTSKRKDPVAIETAASQSNVSPSGRAPPSLRAAPSGKVQSPKRSSVPSKGPVDSSRIAPTTSVAKSLLVDAPVSLEGQLDISSERPS